LIGTNKLKVKLQYLVLFIGLLSCENSTQISIETCYSYDAKLSQLPDSVKMFISNANFLEHKSTTYGYYLYYHLDSLRYKFLAEQKYVLAPWVFEVSLYDKKKDVRYSFFGAERTPMVLYKDHLYIPNFSGVPGVNFDTIGYYFRVYSF
jgi:hypothetical protein